MPTKLLLLDLFCGAGGAAVGYARAGFEVIGVDLHAQPNYPFLYVKADALDVLRWLRKDGTLQVRVKGAVQRIGPFDAIHASPPCQAHSRTRKILEGKGLTPPYGDLIPGTRRGLQQLGLPYVIENVLGAPLLTPVMLCGTQFNLRVYRHRLFEGSFPLLGLPHNPHEGTTGSHRGYSKDTPFITVGGHNYNVPQGREAMGLLPRQAKMGRPVQEGQFIHLVGHFSDVSAGRAAIDAPWMTRDELSQAIPLAYTEYIGRQLLSHLQRSTAVA